MNILTRMYSKTASITGRLMLLVLVAGVLSPRSGGDRQALPGIEVLFRISERHATTRATAIAPWFAEISDFVHRAGIDWQYGTISPRQQLGQVNTRPFSPCPITSFFNIPHQNTDEDNAFVYLPAVA